MKLHYAAMKGVVEKRVSERKLSLRKAPEARKLLFHHAFQPRRLGMVLSAKKYLRWKISRLYKAVLFDFFKTVMPGT
jgi:hypothetical protein